MIKQVNDRQSFLHGAALLAAAVVVVKIIGALFKIPLTRLISENGMGFFNTSFSVYFVFYTLATAGLPTALSKLIAENYSKFNFENINKLKTIASILFFILGTICTVFMALIASPYTEYIGNSMAYIPMLALAPSVLLCALSSSYKGFFQGMSNMIPTAITEIIEALGRLVFGLGLAYYAIYYYTQQYNTTGVIIGISPSANTANEMIYALGATAAVLGVTIGNFLGLVYSFIKYQKNKKRFNRLRASQSVKPDKVSYLLKKLVVTAIPIGIGALVISLSLFVDASLLLMRLTELINNSGDEIINYYKGMIPEENINNPKTIPNYLYGCYSFSLALFMLVPTITQSFAISAVPALTNAWVLKNNKSIKINTESVLRLTCVFSIPAGLGLSVIALPLVIVLNGEGGSTFIIYRLLAILGIASVFAAMLIPVSAMLQSINKAKTTVAILVSGLSLKVVLSYYLCFLPELNIYGVAISTLASYFFMLSISLTILVKSLIIKIDVYSALIKPLLCSLSAILCVYTLSTYLTNLGVDEVINCLVSIVFAVLIYSVLLLYSKTITKNDVKMLPQSDKILVVLNKYIN